MQADNNQIILRGRVEDDPVFDHVLYGENFYSFKIAVPRLSGVEDLLPVTLPERALIHPKTGEHVAVYGQLRSYKKAADHGTRLIITVFVKHIEYSDEEPDNHVELDGFLCKPAVFRTTPFMREITDMLIAVNRHYGKSDYLPCIAWGRNARVAREYMPGDPLHISGRLQSRSYTKVYPDGTADERTAYEVSCSNIAAWGSHDM